MASRLKKRVSTHAHPWQIGRLVWQRVRPPAILFVAIFLVVSLGVWLLERDAPDTKVVTFLDAVWLNICTVSTVGYGDTFPVTTPGRLVMGLFILFTLTTIGFFLTALNEAVIEVKKMEENGLLGTDMREHIIVCGFSPVARTAIEELLTVGRNVAVICDNAEDFPRAQAFGPRANYFVTSGELTQDILRQRLNAETASTAVIATEDDTANIVAALNIRAINPSVRVVVAVKTEALRQTLIASGVTYVASPFELSGRLVASAAFEPEVARFIDDISSGIGGYDVQQYSAMAFEGRTIVEVRKLLVEVEGPLLVGIARWEEGAFQLLPHPPRDLVIGKRDHLLVLANEEHIAIMKAEFNLTQGR
jgi:voltage-gated potassium channel